MTRRDGDSVVLLLAAAPPYMQRTLEGLAARYRGRISMLIGDYGFHPSVSTGVDLAERRHVRNLYLAGHRVLWQRDSFRELVTAGVAVLDLNPRILNAWLIVLVRKLLRRPTVFWGHAWPRKGPGSRTDLLRHAQRRLADVLVLYTEAQRRDLQARMPRARLIAAPNTLYSRADMGAAEGETAPTDFVYVGRLEPEKKPELLLDAFVRAAAGLPRETRLVFVGSGSLHEALESTADEAGLADRVLFLGPLWRADELRPVYARALVSVSPGYVGLSLIQSMAFGVPMLIARDEPHAPEIEAAVEGETASFFTSDAADELAAALVDAAAHRDELVARREAIAARCATSYSSDTWVERMAEAIELARGRG